MEVGDTVKERVPVVVGEGVLVRVTEGVLLRVSVSDGVTEGVPVCVIDGV